ncbi:MAG TPA: ribosome assembly factor SBDS [Candidatus Altiarchaeales archaeon]|nr:ribosome assembly factor SBDS [Candidatus Altiarchaeales archaeon]
MVSLDDAVVARLKTHGEVFEILVDPNLAFAFREGKNVDFRDLLAADVIFKDSGTGERASTVLMDKIFGSHETERVAEEILKRGDIGLTAEQKRHMIEDKKKQVISIISRNAINPQTGMPHPHTRIEKAMEEAKVHIDPFRDAKEQVENVLKKLKPIIPIKFDTIQIAVKMPAQYGSSCYNIIHDFGKIKKEEWSGDSFLCLIEMPAGLQNEFYNKINSFTHGNVEIKKI